MKHKRLFLLLVILFFIAGIVITGFFSYRQYTLVQNREEDTASESDLALTMLLSESSKRNEQVSVSENAVHEISQDSLPQEQETQAKKSKETMEPVHLNDTYATKNTKAAFFRYEPDAYKYEWEIYDIREKDWKSVEAAKGYCDELNRNVSKIVVDATEDTMIRCVTYYSAEEKEPQEEKAYLNLLEKEIKEIAADDIVTDKDNYLSSSQIPIQVTYLDGTKEEVTGLNNLYFLQTQEETNYSETESGNRIETTTITKTETVYLKTEERQTVTIRYHTNNHAADTIETEMVIEGRDLTAPVIEDISISPFEISDKDQPVTIQVNIMASDNDTPYPYLEYAFLLSGITPKEEDWSKKADFEMEIQKNGTYVAYVRDQAGNISTGEKEIITVDVKPPQITKITLLEENWCQENKIIVDAADASTLTYCFQCKGSGASSGWIAQESYSVKQNGWWSIKVKDAAGNVSEGEIQVQNIDTEAPTIHGIKIKDGD